MKWFTFKLVAVLAVLLAAPLFIPGPDGKPIMTLDDWIPRDLVNSAGKAAELAGSLADGGLATGGDSNQVYSWRDANGTLHFSDTPQAGSAPVEIPDNTLEIPADRFIQHGTRPVEEPAGRKSGQAFLIREGGGARGKAAAGAGVDTRALEALVGGDYSKAGEVLQNLPEIVEQAKQARAMPPEARK